MVTWSETTWSGYPALLYTSDDPQKHNFGFQYGYGEDTFIAPTYAEDWYAYVEPGVVVKMQAITAVGPIYADGRAGSQSMVAFQNVKAQMIQVTRSIRIGPVGSRASSAPWQVVVDAGGLVGAGAGVLVAGGVLATAVANILSINRENRAKAAQDSQKEQEEQDPKQVVGYILQISSDTVMLTPKQPASVSAAVWQVTADGATAKAPDAAIRVDVPGTAAGFLQVTPVSGQGQITCSFTQVGQPNQGEVLVTFNASAAQGGASAQVIVTFEVVLAISSSQPVIRYYPAEKRWVVPDLAVYFHAPGDNTPVRVPFQYGFPDPNAIFTANKDILEQEDARPYDDGLTWQVKMKLKEGVDLEEVFGKNLTQDDGNVTITVTVVRQDGQNVPPATTTYQLRPQVTMVAYSYDRGDTRASGGHTYNDEFYDEMEFVADGVDKLPLALLFYRTDKEVEKDPADQEAEDVVEIEAIGWKAAGDISDFKLPKIYEDQSGGGVFAYDLSAGYALKGTKEQIDRPHKLSVKAKIKSGGKNYDLEQSDYEVSVKPQFLNLQLWVVPGEMRHTSEAYAYLNLLPSGKPFPKQSLMLNIENPAGSSLSFEKCSAVQFTRPEEGGYVDRGAKLVKGSANWSLRYNGLSWKNLPEAIFRVSCELTGKDDTTPLVASETININDNVSKMLKDLLADSELTAKLNNPDFKRSTLPAFCRGPVWNICQLYSSRAPFVCWRMREHIISWLEQRRNFVKGRDVKSGLTMLRSMNGIEFEYYAMQPAHVWAGVFLSGTDRYADYKALDPWWEQKWDNPAYAFPAGLMDSWGEKGMVAKCAALLAVMVAELVMYLHLFGVSVSVSSALTALRLWWTGALPAKVIAAIRVTTAADAAAANHSFTADTNYVKANGKVPLYDSNWFDMFIRMANLAGSGKDVGK